MVLPRRFSASGFLPDVRRHGVTFFHYVGKPLAYILATPRAARRRRQHLAPSGRQRSRPSRHRPLRQALWLPGRGRVRIDRGWRLRGADAGHPAGLDRCRPSRRRHPGPGHRRAGPPARFDEQGRLLNPDEAIGELVNTAGSGAFEGYYASEEANAERMRGGMYHSGDLAYRSEQGFVYFAGRTIDWLRVDGENLGAAPVERVLARIPRSPRSLSTPFPTSTPATR